MADLLDENGYHIGNTEGMENTEKQDKKVAEDATKKVSKDETKKK
jgi:hypothetical protein